MSTQSFQRPLSKKFMIQKSFELYFRDQACMLFHQVCSVFRGNFSLVLFVFRITVKKIEAYSYQISNPCCWYQNRRNRPFRKGQFMSRRFLFLSLWNYRLGQSSNKMLFDFLAFIKSKLKRAVTIFFKNTSWFKLLLNKFFRRKVVQTLYSVFAVLCTLGPRKLEIG